MAKQTFQMHLYASERTNYLTGEKEVKFYLHAFDGMDSLGSYIGPQEVEAEVPDSFDMRAAKLKDKQAELTKVRAEFTNRITQIQREISELQAIEFVQPIDAAAHRNAERLEEARSDLCDAMSELDDSRG